MRVLFCSTGLRYQMDAPAITRLRANAMAEAGLDVTVAGFPVRYDPTDEPHRFRYVSVLASQNPRVRARWERMERMLGMYWTFICEPFLVQRFAFQHAAKEKFDCVYIAHVEPWLVFLLYVFRSIPWPPLPTAIMIPYVYYNRVAAKGRPLSSKARSVLNHVASGWLKRHFSIVCDNPYMAKVFDPQARPNVHIIPEGYRNLMGRRSQRDARENLRMPRGIRALLLFGGASSVKDTGLLFRALEGVPKTFHLYVVGQTGGVYEPTWGPADMLKQVGWERHVHIVPRYVSEEEMKDYFAACDAVVLPYRSGYATSSANLRQATEYGKAIIASDQNLLGQMVRDYNLGLVYKPDDVNDLNRSLREFGAKDEAWFDQVRQNSLRVVADHSWSKIGPIYRQLFESMLSAEPQSRGTMKLAKAGGRALE